jgi:hypothetical protein
MADKDTPSQRRLSTSGLIPKPPRRPDNEGEDRHKRLKAQGLALDDLFREYFSGEGTSS